MEKISEAVQIGVAGYLVKSDWKLDDVVRKVKEKLEGKESETSKVNDIELNDKSEDEKSESSEDEEDDTEE